MSYTQEWKANVHRALDERRGNRSDLARWLSDTIGSSITTRKVQIARVLNTPTNPEAEFVLAVEDWLQNHLKSAIPRRRR